jgi:hypothetical protein
LSSTTIISNHIVTQAHSIEFSILDDLTLPNMHRCLETLEVLHAIYKELEAGGAFDLALTCKAFLEPGLDRVWYEVCSFEPFISSLPDDLLAVATVQTHGNWSYDVYVSVIISPCAA